MTDEDLDMEVELKNDSDEEQEDKMIELDLDRVEHDNAPVQQEQCNKSTEGEEEEEESDKDSEKNKKIWYTKVQPIVDHVRKKSAQLIHMLGTLLSFDEMIIRCLARSIETYQIKNKPIDQGYKLFALTTSKGYCINFTPDGRMAEKNGEQEFKKGNSMGKIESMVLHVTDIIESFRQKHKKRIWNKKRSTRGNKIDMCDEKYDGKYVIAMDNYFTLPKVIKELRDRSIGVVGTARFKQLWPSKELKRVPVDEARFNDFYWTVDEYGTLLGRWMDNNFVFCVSTVHRIGKVIERIRRKPRMTAINKSHVEQVWGSLGKIAIYIPQLIDDYNHWMGGGVDLADQRIAYYQPDLRCRRNWIPINDEPSQGCVTSSTASPLLFSTQGLRVKPAKHAFYAVKSI